MKVKTLKGSGTEQGKIQYFYDVSVDKVYYESRTLLGVSGLTQHYFKKFYNEFCTGRESDYIKIGDLLFCPMDFIIEFISLNKGCNPFFKDFAGLEKECLMSYGEKIKKKEIEERAKELSNLRRFLSKADLPLYTLFFAEFVMFFVTIFTFSKFLVFEAIEDDFWRSIVNGSSSLLLSLIFELGVIVFAVRKKMSILLAFLFMQLLIVGVHTHLWQQIGEFFFISSFVEQIEKFVMSIVLTLAIPLCCFFLAELTLEKHSDRQILEDLV